MSELFANYFNYFTQIEDHFQQARGTALFLLSPLDWALIESWKNAGVPLEAVLRGIDSAFEKWRAKRSRSQMVNSLAWCSQAVMAEAQRMADGGQARLVTPQTNPFPGGELQQFIGSNATAIRATGITEYAPIADSLDRILAELPSLANDLEALEERLSVLEQSLVAIARSRQTEEQALNARKELESYLRPYRSRMTAPQIVMLQTQFLERATLESGSLPRLSLFYLR